MTAGHSSATSEPRGDRRSASDSKTRPARARPVLRADVPPDARDRPDLERHEDAPERPLERPRDLHRRRATPRAWCPSIARSTTKTIV